MRDTSVVALVRCDNYDPDALDDAVLRGLDLLGGVSRFAKKDERILLKPNLLAPDLPEKATCTHPAVFRAVAKAFQTTKADLRCSDSTGMAPLRTTAKTAGILDVVEELGIPLDNLKDGRRIQFDEGIERRFFHIGNAALESDGIINISKMKTHGLTRITGAVKNQFGCVAGFHKVESHFEIPNAERFSKMLLDLNRLLPARLYIMDGIIAMDNGGPRSGDPKPMRVLLFSEDPVALDACFARLIDLPTEHVASIRLGPSFGLGNADVDRIRVVGDSIDSLRDPSFRVDRTPDSPSLLKGGLGILGDLVSAKPYIHAKKCTRCGNCVRICPAKPKAVDWKKGDKTRPPRFTYASCIRCYCCHEFCPSDAVYLKTPPLRHILNLLFFRR